jgi:hypothetical protein
MSSNAAAASDFLRDTTLKSILGIADEALDQVMATAYALYQAGRYQETDVLCRGLIAADHTYWWSHSLHAATLRRLGRLGEALAAADAGLRFEPGEPKLLLLRHELLTALARPTLVEPPSPASLLPSSSNPPAARASAGR